MKKKAVVDLESVRTAVADYMESEGCSCCRDVDNHSIHNAVLAKLLHVRKYKDGSGYDFGKYVSKKR
ncbi:MAG: hypothetical protein WC444_04180 [Candidatus Paceibacterota bacterium]